MKVELTEGCNGEQYLQIMSSADSCPLVPVEHDDHESRLLEHLAELGCCDGRVRWDGDDKTKPVRSVTLRLHDPRVEVLAGAIRKLSSVAENLGLG